MDLHLSKRLNIFSMHSVAAGLVYLNESTNSAPKQIIASPNEGEFQEEIKIHGKAYLVNFFEYIVRMKSS
jgi:hypothetical protein